MQSGSGQRGDEDLKYDPVRDGKDWTIGATAVAWGVGSGAFVGGGGDADDSTPTDPLVVDETPVDPLAAPSTEQPAVPETAHATLHLADLPLAWSFDICGLNSGGLAVAWGTDSNAPAQTGDVLVRLLDATLAPMGNGQPITVNTDPACTVYGIGLAPLSNGGFAVCWTGYPAATPGRAALMVRRFDAAGAPLGTTYTIASAAGPVLGALIPLDDSGEGSVAVLSAFTGQAWILNAHNGTLSAPFAIDSGHDGFAPIKAAPRPGGFTVLFGERSVPMSPAVPSRLVARDYSVRIGRQQIAPVAVAHDVNSPRTPVNDLSDSNYQPDLWVRETGETLVTWISNGTDDAAAGQVLIARSEANGAFSQPALASQGATTPYSFSSALAGTADGRFAVAWDSRDGVRYPVATTIAFQRFDSAWMAVGGVVSCLAGGMAPLVRTLADGRLVVAAVVSTGTTNTLNAAVFAA